MGQSIPGGRERCCSGGGGEYLKGSGKRRGGAQRSRETGPEGEPQHLQE